MITVMETDDDAGWNHQPVSVSGVLCASYTSMDSRYDLVCACLLGPWYMPGYQKLSP